MKLAKIIGGILFAIPAIFTVMFLNIDEAIYPPNQPKSTTHVQGKT